MISIYSVLLVFCMVLVTNYVILPCVYSDGETFISADDLRINLWNLEISNQSFNIVDVKPANMEDLTGKVLKFWSVGLGFPSGGCY